MAHASDDARRQYDREYKRKLRSNPKLAARERRAQRLAWRRKHGSKAARLDRARRDKAMQALRGAGMSCPKIAAVLGVSVSTVLRNTRATPGKEG